MRVVLLKDVKRLGNAGDVKRVADGYARNYLIPRGLASPATAAARNQAEQIAAAETKAQVSQVVKASGQAQNLEGVELVFAAKAGESGKLYGSITNGDIAERLTETLGMDIDKRKVELAEPIKQIGKSQVSIRLHSDVTSSITVIVEADE